MANSIVPDQMDPKEISDQDMHYLLQSYSLKHNPDAKISFLGYFQANDGLVGINIWASQSTKWGINGFM